MNSILNFANMKTKRITHDDDIVIVKNHNGNIIYKGMEDYEPMKDELWIWEDGIQGYSLSTSEGVFTKFLA